MDRTLLARATEQSDAPTPGYMYMDIAKNAASNPSTCAEIGQYLTRRLASKQNHNVKFKCLKVISKTAVSPYLRGQFKRYFSQNPAAVEAIKEALQFRGNPDPVRGDEPFQKVRTAAKEALDAIYSDTPADQSSGGGGAPFATSVSTNYGASPNQQYGGNPNQGAASAGSSYPGSSGRRMEGIGNPMFKDHRLEPQQGNLSVNEMVREARETVVGMIKDPLARGIEAQANNHRGSVPRPGGSYGGSGGGGGGVSYCRLRYTRTKKRISTISIVILRLIFSVLFCFDCLVFGATTRSIGFDAAIRRTVEHGIQPRTGRSWYSSEL
jgi:hypothetical protein